MLRVHTLELVRNCTFSLMFRESHIPLVSIVWPKACLHTFSNMTNALHGHFLTSELKNNWVWESYSGSFYASSSSSMDESLCDATTVILSYVAYSGGKLLRLVCCFTVSSSAIGIIYNPKSICIQMIPSCKGVSKTTCRKEYRGITHTYSAVVTNQGMLFINIDKQSSYSLYMN